MYPVLSQLSLWEGPTSTFLSLTSLLGGKGEETGNKQIPPARYVFVVPIEKKSDVIGKFKRFHPWFERKFDCKIQALHCDGVAEYVSCDGYLQTKGIERHFLPPYTPKLNGMAQRVKRTLMESPGTKLYHVSMPSEFWAEAVVHEADIRNRFIFPRSSSKTPDELLTGNKTRVDHLRVVGSHD